MCFRKSGLIFVALVLAVGVTACSRSDGGATTTTTADPSEMDSTTSTTHAATFAPVKGCPSADEMAELDAIRAQISDGPADAQDVANAERQLEILEPYVPDDLKPAFESYRPRLLQALEEAMGVNLADAFADPSRLTEDELARASAMLGMATDEEYVQLWRYFYGACSGVEL